jgi:hypothetical protein
VVPAYAATPPTPLACKANLLVDQYMVITQVAYGTASLPSHKCRRHVIPRLLGANTTAVGNLRDVPLRPQWS